MGKSGMKFFNRAAAVILAVIMALTVIPMSMLTATAVSYHEGDACKEWVTCEGKMHWIENNGTHYLVCENEECPYNAIDEAYLNHSEGDGDADCLICNPPHKHGGFVYSVENDNTLVATCGSTGTCDLTDKKVSITISAPSDLKYDGTAKKATISGATEWKAIVGNDVPEITYSAEPKNVGKYIASITVENASASVEFEIVKADADITSPEDLTAEYGKTLATVELPAGFAWKDETLAVGEIGENTFEATFTPADTDNFNVIDVTLTVTVVKASREIEAPTASVTTTTSVTLNAVTPSAGDGTVKYGYVTEEAYKNDSTKVNNWQEETVFNGLEGGKSYYFFACVTGSDNYKDAVSLSNEVKTSEKKSGKLTVEIKGWTYGNNAEEPTVTIEAGDYTPKDVKIEYLKVGQTEWSTKVPTEAGKYTVRASFAETKEYKNAQDDCNFEISKREIEVAWDESTLKLTYNADNQQPTATFSGNVDGDKVSLIISGAQKNVGDEYDATVSLNKEAINNYEIKENKKVKFEIVPKEINLAWGATEFIHKEESQKPSAKVAYGEVHKDDKDKVEVNVTVVGEHKRPGQYEAKAELIGESAHNYVIKSDTTKQFVIKDLELPQEVKQNPFTIVKASDGETIACANSNNWYNYGIKIKPADGYKIGIANNKDEDFKEYILITESVADFKIFLMDAGGCYTGEIPIGNAYNNVDSNINIDTTNPTASVTLDDEKVWNTFVENITFGIFSNTTQTVEITAKDDHSGIESVFYHVRHVRMSYETIKTADIPWTEGTTVTFDKDNDYVVYAKIVDKAGNITYASSDGFVYDSIKPVINVSFDNNSASNGVYFNADRRVKIQINEHNFDASLVDLTISDASDNDLEFIDEETNEILNDTEYFKTYAKNPVNWKKDENSDVYTLMEGNEEGLLLKREANYKLTISCKDKAENINEGIQYAEGTVAGDQFTIDKTKPNISLTIDGLVNGKEVWDTEEGDGLVVPPKTEGPENPETSEESKKEEFNYNRWSSKGVTVSAEATDTLSDVDYIEYFKTENIIEDITASNITWINSTKNLTEGRDTFQFSVEPNEKFIVYAHVFDKAGNDIYLSSNGVIVDDKEPGGDNYAPNIDITLPNANANGFYNEDDTVTVKFTVVDPKYPKYDPEVDAEDKGVYSGINDISYSIVAEDIDAKETGRFNLTEDYSNIDKDKETGFTRLWSGSITIDKTKFNSNNVVVQITATDNAGNKHTTSTKEGDIKIDITEPTIDVSYDNNSADNSKYFKENRTATIVITERNFKSSDVNFKITNTDGVIPRIGEWTKVEGTGNGDNTTWTTTVVYSADGDYTFDVAYTDLADNACAGAQYGNSVAPREFTVDKTLPVISVSYDNNNENNGKYFKDARIARIDITEHNFDVNRVKFTQTASLNGKAISVPEISWTNSGDTHTATIVYNKDGDYTFDVSVTDMAANESAPANYGNSVAGKDFVVDQTIDKPVIGGVANASAYKNDVIPTISFSDINYEAYSVSLVRTRKGEKNIDVTEQFIKGITENAQSVSGTFDTFGKIVENDGIYTLLVKVNDKAGNEESEEYTFTVNRFGSVYEYSDELVALIKDGGQYVKKVESDLVITEYNADKLLEGSLQILITRDGEAIDVEYTSTPINAEVTVGESGWYQYVYTINASNFEKDGVYKISLASKYSAVDSPENDSTSVPENSSDKQGNAIVDTMNFTVDSVAPEIRNIVNLEEDIINAQTVDVKYTIVDVGGLKSIEVILNGKTVDTITEFTESVYNYSGQFTINESNDAQTVQIKVTDLANNVTDTASESFTTKDLYIFNDEVTVSTNFFVRWYANKALFWGSIGGTMALIAAAGFIIAAKKKKKTTK